MFSHTYYGCSKLPQPCFMALFWIFRILHCWICFNLSTVPFSEVPGCLLMPTTKKTWRQLVSAENNWWTLVRYQAIKTDGFGKESGSADPVYGYADPDTCVIIGCVFGILKVGLNQCSGSESGSTCFWASWFRIRIHQSEVWIRIRILLSSCKNSKKNLDSYYFVTLFDFLSLENYVNVPSKSNKQKKCLN